MQLLAVPLAPGRQGGAAVETRDPSDIDRIVSERILARRNELKMSQPELAERVGVTFQQVQKYENGKNRISAGRLYEVAKALGVTIQFFYEAAPRLAVSRRGVAEEQVEFEGPDTGEELELLGAFRRIQQPGARKAVIDLAKKQAKAAPKPRKR
jgi:transcriptional regulator with XRE-family HTH domain